MATLTIAAVCSQVINANCSRSHCRAHTGDAWERRAKHADAGLACPYRGMGKVSAKFRPLRRHVELNESSAEVVWPKISPERRTSTAHLIFRVTLDHAVRRTDTLVARRF